jgi:hypothetical protein
MLQEEKMEVSQGPTASDTVVIEQNSQPTTNTTYPPTTSIRPLGAMALPGAGAAGGGNSMLNKFKNLNNEEDALNKLKQAGVGGPTLGGPRPGGLRGMPI